MEKSSYGNIPWYESILQPVRNIYTSSNKGWEAAINRPSVKFRRYSGVAGIIRRRMVISISVALFSGSFAILTGFFLYAMRLVDLTEAVAVIGLLFVIGLVLNGWLLLRLMNKPLKNIEHVEDTLVKMVESGKYKLEEGQQIEYQSTPFVQSYYSLLDHVDSIEAHNLEFLAQISHEIRSPLASILGYSELLTDSELRHDDRFIDSCYHIIRKEGNQVCRLVEDAVLAAGIDSGQYKFDFKSLNINSLLQTLIQEEQKRTKRTIIYDNLVGEASIRADAIGLCDALKNLIDNAVKFSSPATPVKVVINYAKNPDWIEISISDQGIGIEDSEKSTIFRRFSRLRTEQTKDIPGNGLGLYIANNIILSHNGEIKVNSEPEVGSTFTICLPVDGLVQ